MPDNNNLEDSFNEVVNESDEKLLNDNLEKAEMDQKKLNALLDIADKAIVFINARILIDKLNRTAMEPDREGRKMQMVKMAIATHEHNEAYGDLYKAVTGEGD